MNPLLGYFAFPLFALLAAVGLFRNLKDRIFARWIPLVMAMTLVLVCPSQDARLTLRLCWLVAWVVGYVACMFVWSRLKGRRVYR